MDDRISTVSLTKALTEARALQRLEAETGSRAEVARRYGVSRPHVVKRLALLRLDPQALEALEEAGVGVAAAYALSVLEPHHRDRLVQQTVEGRWSTRRVVLEARSAPQNRDRTRDREWSGVHPDAAALAVEMSERLSKATGADAHVTPTRSGGFSVHLVHDNAAELLSHLALMGIDVESVDL